MSSHMKRRYTGQGPKVSWAQEPPSPRSQGVPLSQYMGMFTNQEALPNLIFIKVHSGSMSDYIIGQWQLSSWGGAKSSDLLSSFFFWQPTPSWSYLGAPTSHFINVNSDIMERGSLWITDIPVTQEIPKVIGALCQKLNRDQIYIYIFITPQSVIDLIFKLEENRRALPSLSGSAVGISCG